MENNEDFWLQINDGSGWATVAGYAAGSEFTNGSFYNESVMIANVAFSFRANVQVRFRCDASGNSDFIYIDEVVVEAR
jgi:hypothetical protein